jgi:hypothetical protein
MDVDHVWDGFFLYSLLLDHAECGAVLKLNHNAASQAMRICPALQARNCQMRGTEQEEWGHACELCAWVYVDEDSVKSMSTRVAQCKIFFNIYLRVPSLYGH